MTLSGNWAHKGYMDGLLGLAPDPQLSGWADSEYNDGWIAGDEDRRNGAQAPKFFGPSDDLPVQPGDTVTIRKGTIIKAVGQEPRAAGRTYQVKVNHILEGSCAYLSWDHREFVRPTEPKIVWAGSGGYWCEVSINDVVGERA